MARLVQWEQQIGRRLRLRDLFVFFTVVEYGSMAKAAVKLGVATPSISEVIADLEYALGVRLLDRTSKGVTTTPYGEALRPPGLHQVETLTPSANLLVLKAGFAPLLHPSARSQLRYP